MLIIVTILIIVVIVELITNRLHRVSLPMELSLMASNAIQSARGTVQCSGTGLFIIDALLSGHFEWTIRNQVGLESTLNGPTKTASHHALEGFSSIFGHTHAGSLSFRMGFPLAFPINQSRCPLKSAQKCIS